jgi:ribosomal protein L16/L10AE
MSEITLYITSIITNGQTLQIGHRPEAKRLGRGTGKTEGWVDRLPVTRHEGFESRVPG